VQPGHLGAGSSFVDEHEAVRVEVELALERRAAAHHDVGTILLRCMPGLFLSVVWRRAKNRGHKGGCGRATTTTARNARSGLRY